jgi:hypothetical protein
MDYFWIIPVLAIVVLAMWGFYAYIKRNAGEREDGTVLTDNPRTHRQNRV